jgi:hypothetical protein
MSMVTLLGFAALSVDLATCIWFGPSFKLRPTPRHLRPRGNSPTEAATHSGCPQMANQYAAINPVLNQTPVLDPATDVVFGQAILNPATASMISYQTPP